MSQRYNKISELFKEKNCKIKTSFEEFQLLTINKMPCEIKFF